METRQAVLEDIEDISHIHASSWRTAYKGIVPQTYLDELKDDFWVPFFQKSFGAKTLAAQLVCDDGRIVGSAAYGKSRDDKYSDWGEIVSIYLLPEYFGKGYGKVLLDAVLADLKKAGYQNVYLWVLKENSRARKFYEKNYFQCNGDECTCEILGKKLVDVRYIFSFND